ncbi:Asp-tRNA(Asn)/Glu-tRNA(Gln) amidotransferase subunit GatB [Xanthocytophaga flava]|uniref:Asp-tRNA(Asn)/Glu-tRNA(Gln) amidotransferase subunit GatB n=1 Tax=Xanthocytophaga flava TaxID=3048013 RepID=UPI0028D5B956|nr:Asp-tRNA(Asn)/Glu-tRNA(Gln) amidotransferase subunit GatB [Xanthocytophaga flavus]MDJ1472794.1 Asp-tRNA(Asn)/Glu-tRNA(Gln) amidotransferase subunit GatB [Xanthocytophaga flavus]
MEYEVVIGLEVHCQLLTNTKIFAADAVVFGDAPNTHISVITLGYPGTLPKLNKKAVEFAIKMGLACGSEITRYNVFARKNYFYPDLPKGYQISQDKTPICVGGGVTIKTKNGEQFIQLHHIHLEEDAGKSIHAEEETDTLLDYNRAGTALIEIVTDPVMKTSEEAAAYLTEVRKLVRYLEICDGNMEEGSLRCDANISIMPKGSTVLGTKVEVKNMNSIRNVQRAIDVEIERQKRAVANGEKIIQETRLFDVTDGRTYSMRTKETMNDYRYFPDPDLAPFVVSEEWLVDIKAQMPALPHELHEKFVTTYKLPEYDATVLTDTKEVALYFDKVCSHTTNYKSASNWVMGHIKSYLNENHLNIAQFPISPETLSGLIELIDKDKISHTIAAHQVFPLLIQQPGKTAQQIAEENNLLKQNDDNALQTIINEVLAANPQKVKEYKFDGKKNLVGMFMGEVMKKSGGKADPKLANQLLIKTLSEN